MRSPRRRTPAGRATSTSGTGTRTSSARGSSTRRSTRWRPHAEWLDERARAVADGGAYIRVEGDPDPTRAGRRRPGPCDARRDARQPGDPPRPARGHAVLEHLLLPDGRAGRRPSPARPASTRLWDAVATAVRLDEPDPSAAWEAHIDALERRGAELTGAPLRRDPVPRSRHRSDRRAAAGIALEVGHRDDRLRRALRRQHADRGDLHDARPPAGRGRRALDAAAAVRGRAGARASRSSSRAAGSCGSTPTGTPSTSAARWRATRAPPSSARSRW